jgi:hypothetical protein
VADITLDAVRANGSQPFVMLHEDAFEAYFEPYRHPAAETDIWNNLGNRLRERLGNPQNSIFRSCLDSH